MKKLLNWLLELAWSVAATYQNSSVLIQNTGPGGSGANLDVPVVNPDAKGLHLIIDITTANMGGGAGSIIVTIQGIDEVSGKKYTILASVALGAVATTVLRVGPGLTAAGNTVANDMIPHKFNINIAAQNANPMVYTIGAQLIR